MTVSELKLLLTRIPDSAEVTVNYAGEILGVEKATLDFPQASVDIEKDLTWQETAARQVRVALLVKEKEKAKEPPTVNQLLQQMHAPSGVK